MNDFARMWLGILMTLAGFWLAVARTLGAFGNPHAVDGALLAVLILVGVGVYLVATQLDRDRNVSRETSERNTHDEDS